MDRGTFADLLKSKKKIPENFLSRMSYDILSGLEYLHHTLHIIHRYFSFFFNKEILSLVSP
jgi:serine/threonine protein kinase